MCDVHVDLAVQRNFTPPEVDAVDAAVEEWRSRRTRLIRVRQPAEVALCDGTRLVDALQEHDYWRQTGRGKRLVLCGEDLSHLDASKVDFAGVRFVKVRLDNSNLVGASLAGCWLERCDLFRTDLTYADLALAQLYKCDLSYADLSKARVPSACFARCVGLFGANAATSADIVDVERSAASKEIALWKESPAARGVQVIGKGRMNRNDVERRHDRYNQESRKSGRRLAESLGDVLDWFARALELGSCWSAIRSVGNFLVVGSATFSVGAIVLYERLRTWYNAAVETMLDGRSELAPSTRTDADDSDLIDTVAGGDTVDLADRMVQVLPFPLGMPLELVLVLLAFACVAIAALIYRIRCPSIVREYSRVQWTREHDQPLLEYASAEFAAAGARALTAMLYLLGGGYLLGYVVFRAGTVVWSALASVFL